VEAARRRGLWWKAGLIALAAFIVAVVFSAYLRPDMVAAFGDVMAFCAALLK
jgi:hypothetical protein